MDSAEFSPHEFSNRLLAYLREELADVGVGYNAQPASLAGGFETKMYRFELADVPHELEGPLVLRVFPSTQPAGRSNWESAVQNSLADQTYPVPRVVLTGKDTTIFGGPFLVMRFMPGDTLLEAEPERTPAILGAAHAELHGMNTQPLIEALHVRGVGEQWFRVGPRLDRLSDMRGAHPWLADVLQWLVDNKPPEPDRLSICHGDFHPLNILVQEGQLSAVLDWSGFSIADPAMDVAFTYIILDVAAREILRLESIDSMLASYHDAYESVRTLDTEYLDYYRTLRCVMALVEGARGQDVWARPNAVARLTEKIQRNTGIVTSRG